MPFGRVSAFDGLVGLGEITDADGAVWPFHCVEITDGSRSVEVGAAVEFVPLAKLGRREASSIRPT
jgi:CspA family cold shock protein